MKKLYAVLMLSLLSACSGPNVQVYHDKTPALDLVRFFAGTTDAWGTFQKRSGEVTKRFHVEIIGTAADGGLTLDERFAYDDGTTQRRVWRLKRGAGGAWSGTADDVKGQATGVVSGNTLHWQYTLLLPVDGTTYEMQFDDWMYLIDESAMLNRASMRKFGVELGEVTLFFKKRM